MERKSDRSEQRGEYEAPAPGMCRAGTKGDARGLTRGIPGTDDKGQARLRGGPYLISTLQWLEHRTPDPRESRIRVRE